MHPPPICKLVCSVATLTPKQESTITFSVGSSPELRRPFLLVPASPVHARPGQARLGQELSQHSLRSILLVRAKASPCTWLPNHWSHYQNVCRAVHYRQRRHRPVATCSITYAHAKFKISGRILTLGSIGTRWKEGRSTGRSASVPCSCSFSRSSFQLHANRKADSTESIGRIHFCIWSLPLRTQEGAFFVMSFSTTSDVTE